MPTATDDTERQQLQRQLGACQQQLTASQQLVERLERENNKLRAAAEAAPPPPRPAPSIPPPPRPPPSNEASDESLRAELNHATTQLNVEKHAKRSLQGQLAAITEERKSAEKRAQREAERAAHLEEALAAAEARATEASAARDALQHQRAGSQSARDASASCK